MTSKKNLSLIIKDLIFTGLIATVLLIPIVGFRTEISTTDSTGLIFNYNFIIAFLVVGFIVGVRFLFHIYWFSKIQRKPKEDSEENKKKFLKKLNFYLGATAAIIAFTLPFMPFANRYVVDVATLVLTYVMLGWGLNIVVGLAGLLDLGYVAFFAVGAYSYALLATTFDLSFWICLPLAGILAAFAGILLGFPVLRLISLSFDIPPDTTNIFFKLF